MVPDLHEVVFDLSWFVGELGERLGEEGQGPGVDPGGGGGGEDGLPLPVCWDLVHEEVW